MNESRSKRGVGAITKGRRRTPRGLDSLYCTNHTENKPSLVYTPSPLEEMKTWDRCVTIWEKTVVKRELGTNELLRLPNGEVIYPFWPRERLQNEAATLNLIRLQTTIPVPDCRLYTTDGLLHLETTRITGGVLLMDIDESLRAAATKAVDGQLTMDILPQLRKLRRKRIGSIDESLPVFPPQRVYDRDRRSWPQVSSERDEFVLCHNDLAPQNIFIHPETFRIVGIIDWEFAGYFPENFELPLWKVFDQDAVSKMYEVAQLRDLRFFGLELDDLKDCSLDNSTRQLRGRV